MAADQPGEGFLASLSPQEWGDLRARGALRRCPRGWVLCHEGEAAEWVFGVVAGRVKVSYFSEAGSETVLAVRGPGDLIGELSAIDGEPRSATASAMEPVETLVVSASEFRGFLERNSRVSLLLLGMVVHRLREADRKRIEFGSYDTIGRVARQLVELARRYGEPDGQGVRIALPLTQQELAGWTGSSREAVSKALQALRQRGWISTHRKSITVLDPAELRRRAT